MKHLGLSLLLIFGAVGTSASSESEGDLELRLVTVKDVQLVSEMPDIRLFIMNTGAETATVSQDLLDYKIEAQMDGMWVNCGRMQSGTPGVREAVQWRRLAPGERRRVGVGGFWCPADAGPVSTGGNWTERAGEYQLRVQVSHEIPVDEVNRIKRAPGSHDWVLQSNVVDISVQEPTGIDADALEWASNHGLDPSVSVEIANRFPGSRYAALVIWRSLSLHDGQPEQLKEGVDRGSYPGRTSVPDPLSPSGQRTINAGADMARWRIVEGERLLREQIDFPYERDIRLSIAVSYAAVGDNVKASQLLADLRKESHTQQGRWAEEFLELQGWQ